MNALPTFHSTEFSLTASDVERIITGFEQGTLPKAEWTHAAHLVMAMWYALHLPESELLSHIRPRIRAYNLAVGVENTTTSGYHETLTVFYIHVVVRFLKEFLAREITLQSPETLINALLQSECARREYPLRFYTKERLFSSEARTEWLPPENALGGE
ncbi:MAG: hypothetical protein EAZ92_08905 [Candidatus Kapaibacterium sp.]|nr:MAG: hypothetical protein EAZ92_08905 [Candidatus Kapabacteria bacterium]